MAVKRHKEELERRKIELKNPRGFGDEYVPHSKRSQPIAGQGVFVAKVVDLPPGKAKAIVLPNVKVAVFNIDGKFYAIKDACPHAEYPLSHGLLHGDVVTCSSHSWRFNVKTGQCLHEDPTLTIRTFKVEVRNGEVWVMG